MEKNRNYFLDNLKALLIFLVVLGHLYTPLIEKSQEVKALYIFLYSFGMPLFIFVSGYLSKNSNKTIWEFTKVIIMPYLVFNSIWYGIMSIESGKLVFSFLTPYGYMWYLLSLFTWKVLIKYLPKKPYIILLSLIVGLIVGCMPFDTFLSLSRTLTLFPFFLMGYFCSSDNIKKIKELSLYVAIIFISMGGIITFGFLKFNIPLGHIALDSSFESLKVNYVTGIIIRGMIYLVAIVMSIGIMRLVPSQKLSVTYIGKSTMTIYLGHIFIRKIIVDFSPNMSEMLYTGILLVSPIIITYLLSLPIFTKTYNFVFVDFWQKNSKVST